MGRIFIRRRNESENVYIFFRENSEENGKSIDFILNGDNNDEEFYFSLEIVDEKDEICEEFMLCEDMILI